jgi:signal transduction histidine kinase
MVGSTLTTVSLFVSVIGSVLFVAAAVGVRATDTAPGSRSFRSLATGYVVLLGVVATYFGVEWAASRRVVPAVVENLRLVGLPSAAYLSLVVIALLWLRFALQYTGYDDLLTRGRRVLLWTVPVLSTLLVAMSGWLLATDPTVSRTAVPLEGVLRPVQLLYLLALSGIGAALVVQITGEYEHLDSTLGGVLGVGTFCPAVAVVLLRIATPDLANLFVVLALAVGAVTAPALLVAVHQFDPFAVTPAVRTGGRDALLDELEQPVFVVDADGVVVEVNAAAERRFQTTAAESAGEPIDGVFESSVPSVERLDTVELTTPRGRRYFDVNVSPVTDGPAIVGYVLILTDITDQRAREQRLAVLNRVVRHNLRNDMTAIITRSETLTARSESEALPASVGDFARPISSVARGLADLGEKAREVERLVDRPVRVDASAPLAELVEEVVEAVAADHSAVAVTVDVPDVTVGADPRVLRSVLRETVENACEHNDADEPRVTISGDLDRDRTYPVAVTVTDNGPGIPRQDRETLVSEEETALQHASGLGLWLVKWGVTHMNADVAFASNDPRGSVVTLRLPLPEQKTEVIGTSVETATEEDDVPDDN